MKYIPQAPPFEMIDQLKAVSAKESHSQFTIPLDNIFTKNGLFTEPGLIENMAQTAAAGIGYLAQEEGKEPPLGFIGQVKNLKIYFLPQAKSTLNTSVTVDNSLMNIRLLSARILDGEKLVAEGELKVFLSNK